MMPLRNERGETEARLFFTAYTLETSEPRRNRPLMFSFNGGPGSSSVWLHLGGLGPRRVRMVDDGAMPAPPFELVDNAQTWLEFTDLVFIDPVDTGYSRAATPELAKQYCGVQMDIESVGEFIRLYLTRYQRWASPLFLVGESYGTFRAAGLASYLIERGIALNGIVLVSSILDLMTARFDPGNDLPAMLYVPSYAATAWYHRRLPADLQERPLPDVLAEVESWAASDLILALAKGANLSQDERAATAERLARYTGLPRRYVELSDFRIEINRFCQELLRDEGRIVGRLDSRFTGFATDAVNDTPEFDPSLAAIRPPFTMMLNNYVRSELGYETDLEYHILRSLDWDWGSAREGYPKTAHALEAAFARNPYLHLFVASGYFDLATPYFATRYTLSHLSLDPDVRKQIRTADYPVGHMVYLDRGVLARLQQDVAEFVGIATAVPDRPLR
jgi:carboxypeptidase C (cathepsin A)